METQQTLKKAPQFSRVFLNKDVFQNVATGPGTASGVILQLPPESGVVSGVQAVDVMRELRSGTPRGQLRVSATVDFGRKIIAALLRGFYAQYPDIAGPVARRRLDGLLHLRSHDVACRNGRMDDSQVVAKQLENALTRRRIRLPWLART